jgi:hypothetical protein
LTALTMTGTATSPILSAISTGSAKSTTNKLVWLNIFYKTLNSPVELFETSFPDWT